ncbi:MAG TPA: ABC transporter ATP-binding protein, partial [Bryobacteraceae bacterium]|nr:ABC transporter ATP-binding protein [Bryobacteraceae bacterium]
MRRLLGYLRPYAGYITLSLLFLFVYSALQVCGPLLTKIAVDRYLLPVPKQITTPIDGYLSMDRWTGLTQVSLLYLGVLIGGFLSSFGQAYIMQYTGQRAMFDLRRELMSHLQRLDIAFFDRNPIGRLVTRVTTDVDVLNELFASGLVTILGDVLTLAFIIAIMFRLSPALTGIMLAAMPFVILTTIQFRRTVAHSYRRIRIAIARINAYLQEHVVGIVVLQLFNRERKSAEEFDVINRQHMDAYKDTITSYGWFYPIVEFLGMLALACIIAYGGWRVEQHAMTLGVIVAFLQYGMRFFRPIQDLSEKYNILQSAMASSERVFKLLDTPPEILPPASPRAVPATAAGIEFDRVSFAYKDEDWVLRDV